MSTKNKYLIFMLAFLGAGAADLFYLNSKIIPAIWPPASMTAQPLSDPAMDLISEFQKSFDTPKKADETFAAGHEKLSEKDQTKIKDLIEPDAGQQQINPGVNQNDTRAHGETAAFSAQPWKNKTSPRNPLGDNIQQPPKKKLETQPLLVKQVVVPFESGQYQPTRKAIKTLLSKLEDLSFDETIWVIIDGHSDITGKGKYDNNLLSRQRAESIADVFKRQGALENHLKVRGHGDSQPLDRRDVPEAFAKNRRAEIKIFKDEP